MDLRFRLASRADVEDLVSLSILAWDPVFRSFRQVLGSQIYGMIYPDWKQLQRDVVVVRVSGDNARFTTWVAQLGQEVIGFIVYVLNVEDRTGEIELLAVHPDYQDYGVGTELNELALEKMKESGMKIAVVGTGGDPAHAPARRSYEKAGFTPLPLVRYYKAL